MAARSVTNIKYVDAPQLFQWLKQGSTSLGEPFQVIDVRGSDYVGGHIKGCWNCPYKALSHDGDSMEGLIDRLDELKKSSKSDRINVVFHCAQSQQRGPSAAMKLLRQLPEASLSNFEVWILRGGFNHWQDIYGEDTTVTEDYQADIWSW